MEPLNLNLILDQTDRKLKTFRVLESAIMPEHGWMFTVRNALKMTLKQVAQRMKITPQSVHENEKREANGSITLKTLQENAEALNLKLVYGFVPKDESLEKMVEKRAAKLAREIVMRTSNTMKLEGQQNSKSKIEKNIAEKTAELIRTMPKYLWD
jgi:predicted DNA-binding mobile mystery protein A